MQGLQATFETLKTTRNAAAIDVLISALDDEDATTRCAALAALASRPEKRGAELVLANWNKLQSDDISSLLPKKKWIQPAVTAALEPNSEHLQSALAASESLGIIEALPKLILLAESDSSVEVKTRATNTVLSLVAPLGMRAREARDQATIRKPARSYLAESISRFSTHQNEGLVDAFLTICEWGDGDLRHSLASESKTSRLLCQRLRESSHPSVIQLLAGFVRRRKLEPHIAELIHERVDPGFRDTLLTTITAEPSRTVLRNLHEIGLPSSFRGGESILDDISPDHHAAALHAYVAAADDFIVSMQVIVGSIQRGGRGVNAAATFGMTQLEVPETEFWIRAAVPFADSSEDDIFADPGAHLLQRLIDLLEHPSPALVKSVRRILKPLHADQMLGRFDSLRPSSRRRLGHVVEMIDPNTIECVRDALRHPVLTNRIQAIAMADALAAVDKLSDSFARIAHQDHQEARMQAATAMGSAKGTATLDLLRQMTNLPDCPVKDAAVEAIRKREKVATAN